MKWGIHALLLVLMLPFASAELLYVLELHYDGETISYAGIKVIEGSLPLVSAGENVHAVESIDHQEIPRFRTSFTPPVLGIFSLTLPYGKNIKEIVVRDPEQREVLRIPTAQFAQTCGNSICEPQESFLSCPQECPSGGADDYCDEQNDDVCDPDCESSRDINCRAEPVVEVAEIKSEEKTAPSDERSEEMPTELVKKNIPPDFTSTPFYVVVGAVSLTIILLLIAVITRRAGNEDREQLRQYILKSLSAGYTIQQVRDALVRSGYAQHMVENVVLQTLQEYETLQRTE